MYILKQHNTADGKVRVWQVKVDGDAVHVLHGIHQGVLQHTFGVPGAVGKKGTKSYVSPEEQAQLVMKRLMKTRLDQGYVLEGESAADRLDLGFPILPKNVGFPKPVKELPLKTMERSYGGVTDFDFCFTRKRDGMMAPLVRFTDGGIKLYSRRMDNISDHCSHIVDDVERWLPPRSIVLGEVVAPGEKDDFQYVSSVLRSLPQRARALQTQKGALFYYIFGIVMWDGKEVWHEETMEQMLSRIGRIPETLFVKQVQLIGSDDLKGLTKVIKEEGWEGAVVYLRDGKMDHSDISFNGKPRRPKVYWKVKVMREDDFFILDWDTGSGKNMTRLGSIRLGKFEGEETVDFGWCGSGFTDAQREEFATDDILGKVVQVEYEKVTPDGKLRFPKYVRFHPDKTAEECSI